MKLYIRVHKYITIVNVFVLLKVSIFMQYSLGKGTVFAEFPTYTCFNIGFLSRVSLTGVTAFFFAIAVLNQVNVSNEI